MCGGAIISDLVPPLSRLSRRLTADLLWGNAAADLNKKKNPVNYHSKPLRSQPTVDLDDEFEADFKDFQDYSYDEENISVRKPLSVPASKNPAFKGNGNLMFPDNLFFFFPDVLVNSLYIAI